MLDDVLCRYEDAFRAPTPATKVDAREMVQRLASVMTDQGSALLSWLSTHRSVGGLRETRELVHAALTSFAYQAMLDRKQLENIMHIMGQLEKRAFAVIAAHAVEDAA
jgi:hypothetical protein